MAEGNQGTAFTVFDYLGLALILEPPGVVVSAVMTGQQIVWNRWAWAIPFIMLGALSIAIGRNLERLKKRLGVAFAANGYWPWMVAVVLLSYGSAVIAGSGLFIESNSASTATLPRPPSTAEIASAVVRALPQSQSTGFAQQQMAENAAARASLQAQLDRMVATYGPLNQLGQPLARNPYAVGPILLQSKYTHQEASDLITKVGAIKIIISDSRLLETPDDILPVDQLDFHTIKPHGVTKIKADGIDATINRITTFRENLGKVRNQIQQAISDPTYSNDLGRIIGNSALPDVDSCLATFESTLQLAKKYNAAPELLDDLLAPSGERCRTPRRNFWAWRRTIRNRLDDAEKALRDSL